MRFLVSRQWISCIFNSHCAHWPSSFRDMTKCSGTCGHSVYAHCRVNCPPKNNNAFKLQRCDKYYYVSLKSYLYLPLCRAYAPNGAAEPIDIVDMWRSSGKHDGLIVTVIRFVFIRRTSFLACFRLFFWFNEDKFRWIFDVFALSFSIQVSFTAKLPIATQRQWHGGRKL